MQPRKLGIVVAALLGGCHVLWALLVLTGTAQPALDFIFWAHMLRPAYTVTGFAVLPALVLVLFTTVTGYAFGYIGGIVWRKLHNS